jgi:hypothetical protein
MGECDLQTMTQSSRVAVDTFNWRIHVEWDPAGCRSHNNGSSALSSVFVTIQHDLFCVP